MQPLSLQDAGARLVLRRLEKSFDRRPVLSGIELEIGSGEFLAVVGRSGSGKSTLLRLLSGLEEPSSGSVGVFDAAGNALAHAVRVVFQEPRLSRAGSASASGWRERCCTSRASCCWTSPSRRWMR